MGFTSIIVIMLSNRKWTPDEDNSLKEVVNTYRMGDVIPWSYGKIFLFVHNANTLAIAQNEYMRLKLKKACRGNNL